MKAILEFNLPEEEAEFESAKNGAKYFAAISEFQNELRKLKKYRGDIQGEKLALVEEITDRFYEITDGLVE